MLNPLPSTRINVRRVIADTPCAVGRLAMLMHFDHAVACRTLRRMAGGTSPGTWSGSDLTGPAHAAVGAGTLRQVRRQDVDHFHRMFLRLKSNGVEHRLLIDGTDGGHPDAYNARWPKPLKPPCMLPVALIVIIVLAGESMGVDDVWSAFHQMGPLAAPVSRAIGAAVRRYGRDPMYLVYDVVPQGGTWSATTSQSITLVLAHGADGMPKRVPLRMDGPEFITVKEDGTRVVVGAVEPADWWQSAVENARIVHVDDVVSGGGADEELDQRRHRFRSRATERYGVVWKEFVPSKPRGEALGMRFNCTIKIWGVKRDWAERVRAGLARVLRRAEALTEEQEQWVMGVGAWISLVLQQPAAVIACTRKRGVRSVAEVLRHMVGMAACIADGLHPRELLARMTSPLDPEDYVITDAMGDGWSGASLSGETDAGEWKRCAATGWITPKECCGGSRSVRVEPEEMYYGEALASAWVTMQALRRWRRRRCSGGRNGHADMVVLTDSDVWNKAMRRAYSPDPHLTALITLIHVDMMAPGAPDLAVAHVSGVDNIADGPSRSQTTFSFATDDLPPHQKPLRTTLGRVATCMREGYVTLAEDYLPCCMRELIREEWTDAGQLHVAGCLCEGAGSSRCRMRSRAVTAGRCPVEASSW